MNKTLKKQLPKIIIILGYAVFYSLSHLTGIECIWKTIFGIPCPGCGFTHAIISAIHLDFAAAFSYHPMFWSFPIIVWFFLFGSEDKTKITDYIMLAVLFGFLITWIYKI